MDSFPISPRSNEEDTSDWRKEREENFSAYDSMLTLAESLEMSKEEDGEGERERVQTSHPVLADFEPHASSVPPSSSFIRATLETIQDDIARSVMSGFHSLHNVVFQHFSTRMETERKEIMQRFTESERECARVSVAATQLSDRLSSERERSERLAVALGDQKLRWRSLYVLSLMFRQWRVRFEKRRCDGYRVHVASHFVGEKARLLRRCLRGMRLHARSNRLRSLAEFYENREQIEYARRESSLKDHIHDLESQLREARETAEQEYQKRINLEENMKTAFMRGVSALNLEAMAAMRSTGFVGDSKHSENRPSPMIDLNQFSGPNGIMSIGISGRPEQGKHQTSFSEDYDTIHRANEQPSFRASSTSIHDYEPPLDPPPSFSIDSSSSFIQDAANVQTSRYSSASSLASSISSMRPPRPSEMGVAGATSTNFRRQSSLHSVPDTSISSAPVVRITNNRRNTLDAPPNASRDPSRSRILPPHRERR